MKVAICMAVLALAVAIVNGEHCFMGSVQNCTSTSCSGAMSVVICEHNECTCGPPCLTKDDCSPCTTHTDPDGHNHVDEVHCMDGGCVCQPHMPPNGGHMPNGGHHP